jgi:hypothetical protein
VGRGAPSRLIFEIDVGERLAVGVADDEALVLDGPRRREMAVFGYGPSLYILE